MDIGGIRSGFAYSMQFSVNRDNDVVRGAGSQTNGFQSMVDDHRSRMENAVQSGRIDADRLRSDLQTRFGDEVNEAFGADGSIDYDKIGEILENQGGSLGPPPSGMRGAGGPPMGPPPGGAGGFGVNAAEANANLTSLFGEEADGIVGEDGRIDAERLQSLIDGGKKPDSASGYSSPYGSSLMNSLSSYTVRSSIVDMKA